MAGKRRVFLFILGIAILGMLVLSIGITGLPLQPGNMLPVNGTLPIGNYQGLDLPGGQALLQALRIIYIIALLVLPIVMVYLIISPEARRRLLKFLVRILPFILVIYLFFVAIKSCQGNKPPDNSLILGGLPPQPPSSILPTPAPIPAPSDTAIVLISAGISLVTVLVLGWALWLLWRRRKLDLSPNRLIARQAQSALDALQAGGNLKNTIIRCYYQMSAVINKQRGILRSQAMTPHEFEEYLTTHGLPGEPIHHLTHLFEEVRYGSLEAGAAEEQVALNCLKAIVDACGRTA
ncbi:MAG: DUF4129 domain-containing protein [Anaerolineaceae bacterium]